MSAELFNGQGAVGDGLERFYTPQRLADAIVETVFPPGLPRGVIVEPSVGGGAFVRAIRRIARDVTIIGVDVDPSAPGRVDCDQFIEGDWLDVAPKIGRGPLVGAVVGNTPFTLGRTHVLAALDLRPRIAAFVLPWALWGTKGGMSWLDAEETRPDFVRPIPGRPWPKNVRETAVYEWWDTPRPLATALVPLRGWP